MLSFGAPGPPPEFPLACHTGGMYTRATPQDIEQLRESIKQLAPEEITVEDVDVTRESSPDNDWFQITVTVPDSAFRENLDSLLSSFQVVARSRAGEVLQPAEVRLTYVSADAQGDRDYGAA